MGQPQIVIEPIGEPCLDALIQAIERAKAKDPLAPVSVIVVNSQAGYKLRERLLQRLNAMINVRTYSMDQFALFVAAPRLADLGLRHYTRPKRRESAYQAARLTETRLRPIVDHPDTPAAILSLFELSESGDGSLPAEFEPIRVLFERLIPNSATTSRIRALAAESIASDGLGSFGAPILYLPALNEASDLALTQELCRQPGATVIVGTTGDARTDERMFESLAPLGIDAEMPMMMPEFPIEVISAMDDDDECQSVASAISRLLKSGVPKRDIGILYCGGLPANLERHLQAHQIHPLKSNVDDLSQSPWWHLLRLAQGLNHDQARVQDQEAFVDALADITLDPPQNLKYWLSQIRHESACLGWGWIKNPNCEGDPMSEQPIDAALVKKAVENMQLPSRATYSEFVSAVKSAFGKLGEDFPVGGWYEGPRTRILKILDVLSGLDLWLERDEPDMQTTSERFLHEAGNALKTASGGNPFVDRVYVGPLSQGASIGFSHLFILGAVDSALPAARGRDLATRRMLGLEPTDMIEQDRTDLYTALASSQNVTVCWHQVQSDSGADSAPSRFLIELASQRLGRELMPQDFAVGFEAEWHTRYPSYASKVLQGAIDLPACRHVAAFFTKDRRWRQPHFTFRDRYLDASKFFDKELERREGWIEPDAALNAFERRPLSPSRIDSYLRSPRDFFYQDLLRLPLRRDRSNPYRLDPITRGRLVEHVINTWLNQGISSNAVLFEALQKSARVGLINPTVGVYLAYHELSGQIEKLQAQWEERFDEWILDKTQFEVRIDALFGAMEPLFSTGKVDGIVRLVGDDAPDRSAAPVILIEIKSGNFDSSVRTQLLLYLAALRKYEEAPVLGGCYLIAADKSSVEEFVVDPEIDKPAADLFEGEERKPHLLDLIRNLAVLACKGCFVPDPDERAFRPDDHLCDLSRIYAVERATKTPFDDSEFVSLKLEIKEAIAKWKGRIPE